MIDFCKWAEKEGRREKGQNNKLKQNKQITMSMKNMKHNHYLRAQETSDGQLKKYILSRIRFLLRHVNHNSTAQRMERKRTQENDNKILRNVRKCSKINNIE